MKTREPDNFNEAFQNIFEIENNATYRNKDISMFVDEWAHTKNEERYSNADCRVKHETNHGQLYKIKRKTYSE